MQPEAGAEWGHRHPVAGVFRVHRLVRGLLAVGRRVIMVMSAQFRCPSECSSNRS
jgi:hypothetical protein